MRTIDTILKAARRILTFDPNAEKPYTGGSFEDGPDIPLVMIVGLCWMHNVPPEEIMTELDLSDREYKKKLKRFRGLIDECVHHHFKGNLKDHSKLNRFQLRLKFIQTLIISELKLEFITLKSIIKT